MRSPAGTAALRTGGELPLRAVISFQQNSSYHAASQSEGYEAARALGAEHA